MEFPILIAIVITLISTVVLLKKTGVIKHHVHWVPRVIDAIMAGVNITFGVWLVAYLDKVLPFRIFHGKMVGSCIAFMSNTKPPPLTAFTCCNCYAFLVGIALHELQRITPLDLDSDQLVAISTGTAIVFWRLSQMSFSAAIAICMVIGDKGWGVHSPEALRFLVTPWLAGHGLLYVLALVLAEIRSFLRVYLTGRELRNELVELARREGKTVKCSYKERMRTLFDEVDSSNDARIDATEVKVAIRKLTGNDASLEDCTRIVRLVDIDGNGSLDFNEFCQALEHHHQMNYIWYSNLITAQI